MKDDDAPLLVRALRGDDVPRTPVWFMRQAGRYLPEYRSIREKHRMLDVIRTPELAAEVTLQPLRRFPLDAAIIFADLLNPLIGMGVRLDFVENEGPKIFDPVRSAADVARLALPAPEENVPYTLEALRMVSGELGPKGIPVLGFAGAPFTLAYYLLEEGPRSHQGLRTKRFMTEEPAAWKRLLDTLARLSEEYLVAQVSAGAAAVQVFDSWAGLLSPADFAEKVAAPTSRLVRSVAARTGVPVVYFSTGTAGLAPEIASLGATALGVDWRVPLREVRRHGDVPLQGNLDPAALFAPWEHLASRARTVLADGRAAGRHVFNLGHGILPGTPVDAVGRLVDLVVAEGGAA